MNKPIPKGPT